MHSVAQAFQAPIFALPILIVDDNELNRLFLGKILRTRGFSNLRSVASAAEALSLLPTFKPDLVILDIIMPDIDGFECCAAIRQQEAFRELPILVQTVIVDPILRVKAFTVGATDLLSKPVFPEELCARVMVHLEKRHSVNQLQLYKRRIEQELESAQKLQRTIFPSPNEIEDIKRQHQLDIASHFNPSSEIGGDFWGTNSLFLDQCAFWLVDFSGHGVASALNAFRLQAYLKEHSSLTSKPGEYLSYLNDNLLKLLPRGQFATMFYGVINSQTDTLYYACACAPHPIVLRKDTGKAEILDGSGNLLGIGTHAYPTQSTRFNTGDMLLLYSDALIETLKSNGEFLDEDSIMALLEKYPDSNCATLMQHLLEYFHQQIGDVVPNDDLTLVICTRK